MKFQLVDRIEAIEPGRRIVTTKALSLAEEYLQDHFPAFPVLPGVLMLEAMTQAAAWLVRLEQEWAHSAVVLGAARNVRYASFARPGSVLRCEAEATAFGDEVSKLKASTFVGEEKIVSAKLELRSFNLAGRRGATPETDSRIIAGLKRTFELIGGPAAAGAAGPGSGHP
jgi:3-hydroxyacyl-[acyl-carrier-protein] dehydratase